MRRVLPAAALIYTVALDGCESSPVQPTRTGLSPLGVDATLAEAPTQTPADEISANIQALHLVEGFPYPTIVDPRFASGDPASPDYSTVVGYARAGDAAIWTGHYLAAEAFRYSVTRSPDALANTRRALDGVQGLVDVTSPAKSGLLARFLWPDSWWYADRMAAEEGGHGVYAGSPGGVAHHWLGNTTRDQYSGVFFGLAVAFDLVDDPDIRGRAADLVTRMLRFLLANGWNVPMPDGCYSTTFLHRPDQQLTLLQIGRHVNPAEFSQLYVVRRAALASKEVSRSPSSARTPTGATTSSTSTTSTCSTSFASRSPAYRGRST